MRHFTIGRMGLALLATAVVCLGQTAVASAGGGNSANAKLCQKGGWQTLLRSDGSSFANQDACVSYAGQGGTLVKEIQSKIDCQAFGGTYSTDPATNQVDVGPGATFLWSCNGFTDSTAGGPNFDALANDCTLDGGNLFRALGLTSPFPSSCFKF